MEREDNRDISVATNRSILVMRLKMVRGLCHIFEYLSTLSPAVFATQKCDDLDDLKIKF